MSIEIIKGLYTPDEKAVLDEFFDVPAEQRDAERDWVDCMQALGCEAGLLPDFYPPTGHAVAKIVLQTVAARLPNWAAVYPDGEVITARFADGPAYRSHEKLALLPRFLFSINWASSGPGFSWPMAYYLTWVPGYDRFVVTGSSDSPEGNYGHCDVALGHFPAPTDEQAVIDAAADIIGGDWSAQYQEWDQDYWECFLDAGLIDYARAHAMGKAVWDPDLEDEYDAVEEAG